MKKNKFRLLIVALMVITAASMLMACGSKLPEGKKNSDGYTHISEKEAQKLIDNAKKNNALVIDVRGKQAWKMGHTPNSMGLEYDDLMGDKQLKELSDKDQPIILYCERGVLSKNVAKKLASEGYTNIYEFNGMKYWKSKVIIDKEYKGLDTGFKDNKNVVYE